MSPNLSGEACSAFRREVKQFRLERGPAWPEEQTPVFLRGDPSTILRLAVGRQKPGFLSAAEASNNLLTQKLPVAGRRSR